MKKTTDLDDSTGRFYERRNKEGQQKQNLFFEKTIKPLVSLNKKKNH